ncbi:hypothetical protein AB6A40_004536 [Gnathostoma spinigerum]|uniref:PTTG1 interacting protein n=1 Tax=Gnathostoma spinigerum TaxID=75299 RepID=A0ABD6EMN3_9BILA
MLTGESNWIWSRTPCGIENQACCRSINTPFLVLGSLTIIFIAGAVLFAMLCLMCPSWRVLCDCCLCCEQLEISETGTWRQKLIALKANERRNRRHRDKQIKRELKKWAKIGKKQAVSNGKA